MSQFILAEQQIVPTVTTEVEFWTGMNSEPIVQGAVDAYDLSRDSISLIVDEELGAESLLDDVWEAQQRGQSIVGCDVVRVLCEMIAHKIQFLLWCGSDFSDLTVVRSEQELLEQLCVQTSQQPAEVYLRYSPE